MLDTIRRASLDISVLKRRTALRLKAWIPQGQLQRSLRIRGQVLPSVVGQALHGEPRALCVGRDEWLLVSDLALIAEELDYLEHEATEQHLAIVEQSGAFAALKVRGAACREVLAKGCGLDFRPRVFHEGSCARTLLAQVFVTLDCRAPQEFDVYVARAYLWHLHAWLVDAAVEYQPMIK
jgi:sarcosine oxidase subunit gamma